MQNKNKFRIVYCSICGCEFKTNHSQGKYCSEDCRKEGLKNSWNKYTNKNKQKRRAYYQKYYKKNREKIIERTTAYSKTEKGKGVRKIADSNSRERHPEKYSARQKVLIAKRSGEIVQQSCEVCGSSETEAHHEDYSKPLDIKWLCKKHHVKADLKLRKLKEVNNGMS